MRLFRFVGLFCVLASPAVWAQSGEEAPPTAAAKVQAPATAELWQLPASELLVQSLFRVQYQGPEGQGGFRLTLRLAAANRYRVTTVDSVGRTVWTLSVEGDKGLWVDHHQKLFCRFEGELGLESVPLSPFALPALPGLLLARLPEPPQSTPVVTEGSLEMVDRAGRRWTAKQEDGELVQWTLWELGEPAVWWARLGEESILSERARGIQLRWRRVLAEPLTELPPEPPVGEDYLSGCRPASNPARLP